MSDLADALTALREQHSPADWLKILDRDLPAAIRTELDRTVAAMRRSGATWAEIGDALGVTRQAAQTRFADVVGETRPQADLLGRILAVTDATVTAARRSKDESLPRSLDRLHEHLPQRPLASFGPLAELQHRYAGELRRLGRHKAADRFDEMMATLVTELGRTGDLPDMYGPERQAEVHLAYWHERQRLKVPERTS